jgi:hypothetical protein
MEKRMLQTAMKFTVVSRDLTDKQVQDWPADVYAGTWVTVEKSRTQTSKEASLITLRVGDVWRMSSVLGFSSCVIRGFNIRDEVMVARPYAYASLTGTACPSPLTGVEIISTLQLSNILEHWETLNTGMVTR